METTAISLPVMEVLKVAFSTGIVTALATQGFGWFIDRQKSDKLEKKEAT